MMIDDGYTMHHEGVPFRPVLRWRRAWIEDRIAANDWNAVDRFLWRDIEPDEQQRDAILEVALKYPDTEEAEDEENLKRFLQLIKDEPLLAQRSCDVCRRYWFDEEIRKAVSRGGKPLPRPQHSPVSCETSAGCPKGHYDNPVSLSDRNTQTLWYYEQFRVVGCPDIGDDIVRRNWNLIYDTVGRNGVARYCKANHRAEQPSAERR